MAELLTPDICVIGAGAGGLTVAAAAAAFGVPVVLVEKGRMGGDCLNSGCVPSKSLIAAAKRAHAMLEARTFGILAPRIEISFDKVRQHVQEVIAAIAPTDSKERFAALGVRVIAGAARFRDPATVTVGNDIEIKARRFVLATGSSPALPSIPGLAETPYLTNETVFALAKRPEHLIVIGAGTIGLELAQAFQRLGAQVTVLEAAQPLAREDPECAAIVLDQLERERITLRSGVAVVRVAGTGEGVRVTVRGSVGEWTADGSHLLVATGRQVNIADLGLERARIRTQNGRIVVDKRLHTTNKRVYAIGDAAGGVQFTHAASYHAGLVIRNALFRLPVKVNEDLIPRVTFTDPELAHVGLSEAEARARRYAIRVLRWPFHENDRARAERDTQGHIKVVTTSRGRILGATIVGPSAGELITTWTLAIGQRLNIRAFAGIVMPYPTLAEVGKRAALSYFTPSLTNNLVRRVIVWLRRFG